VVGAEGAVVVLGAVADVADFNGAGVAAGAAVGGVVGAGVAASSLLAQASARTPTMISPTNNTSRLENTRVNILTSNKCERNTV
jgi:hypothetical protein